MCVNLILYFISLRRGDTKGAKEIKGINTAGQSPARKLLTQLTKACGGFPQQSCGSLRLCVMLFEARYG